MLYLMEELRTVVLASFKGTEIDAIPGSWCSAVHTDSNRMVWHCRWWRLRETAGNVLCSGFGGRGCEMGTGGNCGGGRLRETAGMYCAGGLGGKGCEMGGRELRGRG